MDRKWYDVINMAASMDNQSLSAKGMISSIWPHDTVCCVLERGNRSREDWGSQIKPIPLFSKITGAQNCQNVLVSDVDLISYFLQKDWYMHNTYFKGSIFLEVYTLL